MTTTAMPTKKKTIPAPVESAAPQSNHFSQAAAEANHKLDLVHRMLFKEAAGQPIDADEIDLVSSLGWDTKQLKQAKRDAACALSAVRSFNATVGADARAKQLREKRDAEIPKLRQQIAALEQQIGELEYAPRKAERQAEQHTEATKTIRLNAPQFVKQRFALIDSVKIAPMRERWAAMRGELGKLAGLMTHDPQEPLHRSTFERTHDRNGEQPWMLTDLHGRTVIDPQAWRRFVVEEQVEERHDALAEQVETLEREIEAAEVEAQKMLNYWLAIDAQPEATE